MSQKSEDIAYGLSTIGIFSLVAFTAIVPLYRFASFNVNALKAGAKTDLILAETAKKQLANIK